MRRTVKFLCLLQMGILARHDGGSLHFLGRDLCQQWGEGEMKPMGKRESWQEGLSKSSRTSERERGRCCPRKLLFSSF